MQTIKTSMIIPTFRQASQVLAFMNPEKEQIRAYLYNLLPWLEDIEVFMEPHYANWEMDMYLDYPLSSISRYFPSFCWDGEFLTPGRDPEVQPSEVRIKLSGIPENVEISLVQGLFPKYRVEIGSIIYSDVSLRGLIELIPGAEMQP